MYSMSDEDRIKEEATHLEQKMGEIQQWMWWQIQRGWNPLSGDQTMWTHDDNNIAMGHGWILINIPGTRFLDIVSLKPGVKPSTIMLNLVAAAPLIPVANKAVAICTKQRLMYPGVKFAYIYD